METTMLKIFIIGALILGNAIVWAALLFLLWFVVLFCIKMADNYMAKLKYNQWLKTPEGQKTVEEKQKLEKELLEKLRAISRN